MNVVFRVDAAMHIGSGHVMRCLTLADALTQHGASCQFICREFDGNLFSLIESKDYRLHPLSKTNSEFKVQENQSVSHEHWLGVNYDQDATETINILQKQKISVDWLIVDHYAIDIRWETQLRPYTRKIMLIDDLADRKHDCDLLLDQNYFEQFEVRYNDCCNISTKLLLGPQFAILRSMFLDFRHKLPYSNFPQNKMIPLFIFFGGADPTAETVKFVQGYLNSFRKDFFLHIVIGQANNTKKELIQLCQNNSQIKLYDYVENIAELMAKCIYAFGASGTTNWERFCLGINSSIVSIADNQTEISQFLAEQGFIDYMGESNLITANSYTDKLNRLDVFSAENMVRRKKILMLVDGFGCEKVSNIILRCK